MRKIDVLSLIVEGKHRLEVIKKQTVPDLPKTLIYDCKKLRYLKTTPTNILVHDVLITDLQDVIQDLIKKSSIFPNSVLKTKPQTKVLMSYEETFKAVQDNIANNCPFELQEYLPPESHSVMIIRINISGQTLTARVLENIVTYDLLVSNEEKFLLSNYKKSGNMVLSSTTAKLKNSARAIYYMISASVNKKFVMSNTVLDFIRRKNKWFFISAHCQRLVNSISATPKSEFNFTQGLLTPSFKPKSHDSPSNMKTSFKIPNYYLTERKLEDNINKLIDKEQVPNIRYVSYKQWVNSKTNDMVYNTYSKKIAEKKEKVKAKHSKGINSLKKLIVYMGEHINNFELQYNSSELIKKEAGKFLLERLKAFRRKIDPSAPTIKKYTSYDMISDAGRLILDNGSAQLDKMKKLLKKRRDSQSKQKVRKVSILKVKSLN